MVPLSDDFGDNTSKKCHYPTVKQLHRDQVKLMKWDKYVLFTLTNGYFNWTKKSKGGNYIITQKVKETITYSFVTWSPEQETPTQLHGSESKAFQLDKTNNGSSNIPSLNIERAWTA